MSKFRPVTFAIISGCIFLIVIAVPYLFAAYTGGTEFAFTSFLLNPLDGNSYLAKMYQGRAGSWQFKLPFTADPGEGAYLFLFYLSLGHLSRILALPNPVVFHAARLLGAAFLLWTLWSYFGALFEKNSRPHKAAFALSVFGAGVGWMLLPAGALPSDFWVAEAYPFLSSYTNPHFPISLGLMLWLLMPPLDSPLSARQMAALAAAALILSLLSPLGVVIASLVLGAELLFRFWQRSPSRAVLARLLLIALPAAPALLYDLWIVRVHPALAVWDAQNLTPSPPLWDTLVSLSPALLLTGVAAWRIFLSGKGETDGKTAGSPEWRPLLLWVAISLVMMYLPLGLQRRFMMGIYIPLSGLAALGLEFLAGARARRYRWLVIVVFAFALLTNLILLAGSFVAASTHSPQVYLTRAERDALTWLDAHSAPDALILAAPETGVFIPAHTGRRVLYGHPYETVHADAMEAAVTAFFDGSLTAAEMQDFLRAHGVDLIFYGPRERALGNISAPAGWQIVFQQDDVLIFQNDR